MNQIFPDYFHSAAFCLILTPLVYILMNGAQIHLQLWAIYSWET